LPKAPKFAFLDPGLLLIFVVIGSMYTGTAPRRGRGDWVMARSLLRPRLAHLGKLPGKPDGRHRTSAMIMLICGGRPFLEALDGLYWPARALADGIAAWSLPGSRSLMMLLVFYINPRHVTSMGSPRSF
jgi:hypothetical protein